MQGVGRSSSHPQSRELRRGPLGVFVPVRLVERGAVRAGVALFGEIHPCTPSSAVGTRSKPHLARTPRDRANYATQTLKRTRRSDLNGRPVHD
jgi:hypothetical protein